MSEIAIFALAVIGGLLLVAIAFGWMAHREKMTELERGSDGG